jgi:hypothetical protein
VLFKEGLKSLEAERWQDAADRFDRAYTLRPTPEIAYNLTSALVKLGRLVRASELLREVAQDAHASQRVRDAAAVRLSQVEPLLGRLTVLVAGADVVVSLDGRPLESALLGVAIPVDPGLHTISARRGGDTFFVQDVTVADGGSGGISIVAPEPAPAPADAAPLHDAGAHDAAAISVAPDVQPAPVPAAALRPDPAAPASAPIYGRWWFWAGAGALVLAAGLTAVLARPQSVQPESGNVGNVHVGN